MRMTDIVSVPDPVHRNNGMEASYKNTADKGGYIYTLRRYKIGLHAGLRPKLEAALCSEV